MNKNLLVVTLTTLLGPGGMSAQAAMLNPGDLLTINAGVPIYDTYGNPAGVSGGSWFAQDFDVNGSIAVSEKAAIYPGTDGGVRIGSLQGIGEIDIWPGYFSATGYDYTTVAPTGGTTAGIDFSGWSIYWNGQTVPVGIDYGAWTPSNCATLGCTGVNFVSDTAAFSWSGVYGDSYSLWYAWRFWINEPGTYQDTYYLLHLEGTVLEAPAVPVPAAAWLFASGLLGLTCAVRRKAVWDKGWRGGRTSRDANG